MRIKALYQLGILLLVIVVINMLSSKIFTRFDLTAEKRYTLSEASKKLLRNLDDIVFFEIYLDGDLRKGFKRLRRETKEMLEQFRAYSDNIQYEFIDPMESNDPKQRKEVYDHLIQMGLQPTDVQMKSKNGTERKVIFPGAIVSYRGQELPMDLLVSQIGSTPEEIINSSIENLEFNFSNTIRKLSVHDKPKIAFIHGQGELSPLKTGDIFRALQEYYSVFRVKINGNINSLVKRKKYDSLAPTAIHKKYEAIIIAKPDSLFDEKDKFIIDQYIMYGGKVLWLVDGVRADMDSLQMNSATYGTINDVNLQDMLFNYGVRINNNLLLDLSALPIPIRTGQVGNAPKIEFFPWYYFPILYPSVDHPIVKNLNAIKTEFISTLDAVQVDNVEKTVLLTSSKYARTQNTIAYISLEDLGKEPDRRLFRKHDLPVAYLLEGKFPSLYQNRVPKAILEDADIRFRAESKDTKMIVVGDGDIIKNQVYRNADNTYSPYPLGYDRFTKQSFGNKDFILNAMNYLIDENGLISIRSRNVKLRMLNIEKVQNERTYWQILNVVLPLLVILFIALIMVFVRKRRYGRKNIDR